MLRNERHSEVFSLHLGTEPPRGECLWIIGTQWEISPLGLLCTCCGLLGPMTTPGRALS